MTLSDIRRDYAGEPLDEAHAHADPFTQFSTWFEQVRATEQDPTAMALATATRDGRPSVRTVLLKGVDPRGFVFYTNYHSRKAREIEQTGRASLLFVWRSMDRQVRVEGRVEKVSEADSDAYFATRPVESRWSVYASRQSETIESREALESRYEVARQLYGDAVPRPAVVGRLPRRARRDSSSGRDAPAVCTIGCSTASRPTAPGRASASPRSPPSSRRRLATKDTKTSKISPGLQNKTRPTFVSRAGPVDPPASHRDRCELRGWDVFVIFVATASTWPRG